MTATKVSPKRRFFKRHELRQKEALPILSEMQDWLDKSILTAAPKSAIGKAIAYSLNQWPFAWVMRLSVYN
jgi:hypothetical protein